MEQNAPKPVSHRIERWAVQPDLSLHAEIRDITNPEATPFPAATPEYVARSMARDVAQAHNNTTGKVYINVIGDDVRVEPSGHEYAELTIGGTRFLLDKDEFATIKEAIDGFEFPQGIEVPAMRLDVQVRASFTLTLDPDELEGIVDSFETDENGVVICTDPEVDSAYDVVMVTEDALSTLDMESFVWDRFYGEFEETEVDNWELSED